VQAVTDASTDQAIEDGDNVSYRAIVTRRFSDGYVISSAPTNALNVENAHSAPVAVTLRLRWYTSHRYEAGDVIELYRTTSQTTGTDPGAVYRLCATHTIDSTDVSNKRADVVDNCADGSLGAELYTNPGQPSGTRRGNRAPSLVRDMAMFKGYAFYVTPYSNVRARLKILGAVAGDGTYLQGNNIAHGIGTRISAGTFTSGSPTVTGIAAGAIVGLAAGQTITSVGGFTPPGTTITAVGATTVTMSANATGTSGATGFYTQDRIEIQGRTFTFNSLPNLTDDLVTANNGGVYNYPIMPLYSVGMRKRVTSTSSFLNAETDGDVTIIFEAPYFDQIGSAALELRATNGQNYAQQLNALTGAVTSIAPEERLNRATHSKLDQPEHVPEENELTIGAGAIHRLLPTTNALFAFCSDGLYRISGDGGVFRVDIVDATIRLASSSAVDVMLDRVWAYTNRGLVRIGPSGVEVEISDARIKDLLPGATLTPSTDAATGSYATFLTCDPGNREVRLCLRVGTTSTIYLYNTTNDAFTTIVDTTTNDVRAEVYAPFAGGILWAATSSGATRPIYAYDSGAYRTDYGVLFQPFTGDKSAFMLKQWVDFDLVFADVVQSAMTIVPSVNDTSLVTAHSSTLLNNDRRFVGAFTLDAGMAHTAQIGFVAGTDGGFGWRLSGVSLRWTPLPTADQVQK
jgi:hypothetical protein